MAGNTADHTLDNESGQHELVRIVTVYARTRRAHLLPPVAARDHQVPERVVVGVVRVE
jgi:hypothetical protein